MTVSRDEHDGDDRGRHPDRTLSGGRDPGRGGHQQEQQRGEDHSTHITLEADGRHDQGGPDEHEGTDGGGPPRRFEPTVREAVRTVHHRTSQSSDTVSATALSTAPRRRGPPRGAAMSNPSVKPS